MGEYDGNLSNGGENLLLFDSGRTLLDISYGTEPPWPVEADGAGSSLELVDWHGDFNAATNWQASTELHGTPGRVAGAVLRIEFARVDGQRVTLRFTARAGVRYTLAFKPSLNAGNWIPLNEFAPGATGNREYEDLIPAETGQRYYRISSEE